MSQAIVYMIRHGEKPPVGDELSAQGVERSQALVGVFAASTQYNIQYIIAQHPKKDGGESRPYHTILPLAESLGLTPDTSCKRDDSAGVNNLVQNYSGSGNILICWEHQHLKDLMGALGVPNPPDYPGSRFDLIYTIPPPYNSIASTTSEKVSPMDDSLPPPG